MFDKPIKLTLIVTIFILFIVGCTISTSDLEATDATPENDRVIVIGDISDEPAETIEGTQPVADYLAARLGDYGISHGEVKIAPDLDTMLQWIADGEVDLYFDSPYPVLVISQQTGAEPILRRWKYGVSEYHSLFFTRKETGITSLEDLSGHMVAFEESFSTSGFMLPLSYLYEQGMNPVAMSDPETAVAADEVGYVFSTADNTTIQWVVSGKVPVGVVDNITYELFVPEETRQGLVIIAETEDVPRQLVLTRPGMDEDLVAAIKSELINMNESEEGQAALEIFLTTEFDEFPEGANAALDRMRTLYQLVQDQ
jgi:phosphonate transport system substrate-binding protein